MWSLRLQPELDVGSTSGDLKSELGCRLKEWLCSGGAGSGSAAQSLAATHQETRLLDLRLHDIVIHPRR